MQSIAIKRNFFRKSLVFTACFILTAALLVANPFSMKRPTQPNPFSGFSLQPKISSIWNQFTVSHSLAASYSTGSYGNALQNAYTTHLSLKNPQKLDLNLDFGLVRTQWNTQNSEGTSYTLRPNLHMRYQLNENAAIYFHFQGAIPVQDEWSQMP